MGSTLHVPTVATSGTTQGQKRRSRSNSVSSLGAKRGWFPLVLSLLVDLPVLLPRQPDLVLILRGRYTQVSRPSGNLLSGETLQAAGVSEAAALLRDNLRGICIMPGGRPFLAGEHQGHPLRPSPQQVVVYLELLASVPVGHNTILMHLSTLSGCMHLWV